MRNQTITILVFLFCLILKDHAENNFRSPATMNAASSATEAEVNSLNTPAVASPYNAGMSATTLARIDSIVKDGIRARAFPGCQVLVMKDGKPVYDKCFGNYTYETTQKVKPTTMYDLASLSKTTGTLLAIMKLYDNGKLKLTDKASLYLTFLRGTNKENITIKELLFHESGLPAGLPFSQLVIEKKNAPSDFSITKDTTHKVRTGSSTFQYKQDWVSSVSLPDYPLQVVDSFYINNRFHDAAMQMIAHSKINRKGYCYSDINFILLKEIVETISGTSMDVYLSSEYYTPMKLNHLSYLPLRSHEKGDIAPTLKKDYLRYGVIQGYVHDPDAAFFGGVSGNAGLFATARDVATVYQMLLNNGELGGKRYLSAETCRFFTTTTSTTGRRGLGYDKPVYANPHSPCCISAPPSVYGHTGYTGTCCWVDPVNNLVYVFLSNRTYPYDSINKLAKMGIRTKIQAVIYQSIK